MADVTKKYNYSGIGVSFIPSWQPDFLLQGHHLLFIIALMDVRDESALRPGVDLYMTVTFMCSRIVFVTSTYS